MKSTVRILIILAAALSASAAIYFWTPEIIFSGRPAWQEKRKEVRSRLLSIPILLYHNIDGKGVFSIDSDVLASHFNLFRDAGVRVIPLSELVARLENPHAFDGKSAVITFDDGFYSMYSKLYPLARDYGYPVTLFAYTDFIYRNGKSVMTWDMLRELDKNGIDVQCHSISHIDLAELSQNDDPETRKKLYDELYLSKRIIEIQLGKKVDFFAFPYGRYNLKLIDLCMLAGYRRVFSTDYGSNIITRDNYSLSRQHIKRGFTLQFIERFLR